MPTDPAERQQFDRLAGVLCHDVAPTSAVTGQSSALASEATTPRSRLAALADGAGVLGAAVGAMSLTAGVIVVHGFPAMPMIYGGCVALVLATLWKLRLRRACRA